MSTWVPGCPRSACRRRVGILIVVSLLFLPVLTSPAFAVEGEEEGPAEPPPNVEEICATEAPSGEFCPEEYEEPSFFQWLLFPLLAVGVLMAAGMLFAYLVWQPKFAREREEKQRR